MVKNTEVIKILALFITYNIVFWILIFYDIHTFVQDIPAYHVSQTGAAFIRYVTTEHNTGTGWVLQFKLNRKYMNVIV